MTAPAHPQETTIDMKISESHKKTLEKAAAMTGLSLNEYVIH